VDLTITRKCNQRCCFCYEDGHTQHREPTGDEVRDLIRQAGQTHRDVVLCGMEALLRPDILALIDYGRGLGLRLAAFTNGQVLARRGFVAQLQEAGLSSLVISYHFPDAETFARGARVRPQMFERILRGMREVREHNRARAGATLPVRVETDLFALNAGRLAHMRATLLEHLGESFQAYTLGCLTPAKAWDVGLTSYLEPMAERREELLAFAASQPADVELNFVKLPLCLIPGLEHRSFEVRYKAEGASIRHNFYDGACVGADDVTVAADQDFQKAFRANPYRWVCRECRLIEVCRHNRCGWEAPFFLPTREQKPWPVTGYGLAEVLARLNADQGDQPPAPPTLPPPTGGVERGELPEDSLLATLRELGAVEVWAEGAPVLCAELRLGGRPVTLRLGMAGAPWASPETGGGEPLGYVVDYLHLLPLTPAEAGDEAARQVAEGLLARGLPPLEAWEADSFFDAHAAGLLRAAWGRFGRGLWPGAGELGGWATTSARLAGHDRLVLELAHPAAGTATLEYTRIGGQGARLRGEQATLWAAAGAARDGLAAAIRALFGEAPLLAQPVRDAAGGAVGVLLKTALEPGGAAEAGSGQGLLVAFHATGARPRRFDFTVGTQRRARDRWCQQAGRLFLEGAHPALDREAVPLARVLLAAMKHLQDAPSSPDTLSRWRQVLGKLLARAEGCKRFSMTVDWLDPAS
jgi:hypothetical protein